MPAHPLDKALTTINIRLRAARLGLKIERRGEKLSLRGTLPPRPDSPKLQNSQQRIPLGFPANKAGLDKIEKTAKVIAAQLIEGTFDWQNYIDIETAAVSHESPDLAAQIEAFKVHFFKSRENSPKPASVRSNWSSHYEHYLSRIKTQSAKNPRLSLADAIYAAIESTSPNTSNRRNCCAAINAFAGFLSLPLPIPIKSLQGNYGPSKANPRKLPSDKEILSAYKLIPHPGWRFVYGIIATYGLRPHEVFYCDYSMLANGNEEASIETLECTKTGRHEVWPFHAEWVDAFNLRSVTLPNLLTDLTKTTPMRVGQQVSHQFRRYGIPFTPYNLRHAWAVRTIKMKLPDVISAQMMGHSVAMHNNTYHRWISHRDVLAAVKTARQKLD